MDKKYIDMLKDLLYFDTVPDEYKTLLKELVEEKFTPNNTGSTKLPADCNKCQLWCICSVNVQRGDGDCNEARSQLRASA